MDLALIIQLISGAIGGNVAGGLLKNLSLGTFGNSIVGIIGGALGGQLLSALGLGGAETVATGSLDIAAVVAQVAGGGVGGGVLLAIVGLIRNAIAKL
jgi:uncharacterized membrane protein YeaQ/YmgE (transglycosylase-associated protein family)